MNRCPIILFLIISVLLGANSCNSPLKGYSPTFENAIDFRPVFSIDFEKAVYKFHSQFKKNQLTGVVLIKKIPSRNSFRTVIMSETGLKFFDFEFFQNDSVTHHHIMEGLDRKSLIKIISADFSLLLKSQFNQENTKYYQAKNSKGSLLHFKDEGRYYYRYKESELSPKQVEKRNCFSPPIKIAVQADKTNTPENITFTHGFLGYTMKLELLDQ